MLLSAEQVQLEPVYSRSTKPKRFKGKDKGKGLDTCYSAAYMIQTRDQQPALYNLGSGR